MTVHAVEFRNIEDIASMMEAAAVDIREQKHGKARLGVAVFINDNEDLTVYGWGCDADSLHALGLLAAGQAWLGASKARRE